MRYGRTLAIGAMSAAALAAGCFAFDRKAVPVSSRPQAERTSFAGAVDRVILDYRLVDQPAGDPFATDDIWQSARSILTHEQDALLAENGLRVGLISGVVSPEFLARVTTHSSIGNLFRPLFARMALSTLISRIWVGCGSLCRNPLIRDGATCPSAVLQITCRRPTSGRDWSSY